MKNNQRKISKGLEGIGKLATTNIGIMDLISSKNSLIEILGDFERPNKQSITAKHMITEMLKETKSKS